LVKKKKRKRKETEGEKEYHCVTPTEGKRHNKPIIVISMLSNEVHTPWGRGSEGGGGRVVLGEEGACPFHSVGDGGVCHGDCGVFVVVFFSLHLPSATKRVFFVISSSSLRTSRIIYYVFFLYLACVFN
jgi:hypothetical protein